MTHCAWFLVPKLTKPVNVIADKGSNLIYYIVVPRPSLIIGPSRHRRELLAKSPYTLPLGPYKKYLQGSFSGKVGLKGVYREIPLLE